MKTLQCAHGPVEFGLSVEAELFLFGRPLFKVLSARGLVGI